MEYSAVIEIIYIKNFKNIVKYDIKRKMSIHYNPNQEIQVKKTPSH